MDLRTIVEDNVYAVMKLAVHDDQKKFVAPNAASLAEAYAVGADAWPRACYDGDDLVGFVMLHLAPDDPHVYIWRMMIGADHQRKGYGKRILDAVVAHARTLDGKTHLLTSYVPGDGSPGPFYEGYGFAPTGEVDEGEIVLRYDL